MKLHEIVSFLETFAPTTYQESYDNSGLLLGDIQQEITGILLTIDITEEVINEAITKNVNLVLSHHPLIFNAIKRITGKTYVERSIIKAIKNNIAIYAAHTNFDSIKNGVNKKICEKLDLINCRILAPLEGALRKLVTFVPKDYTDKVRMAIFNAGAGTIGEYDQCSYNIEGVGTFRGSDKTNPFCGEKGKLSFEKETRIETIFPKVLQSKIIKSMIEAHPYEEVAYDIYPLDNTYQKVGLGMLGEINEPVDEKSFLHKIKKTFNVKVVKHSILLNSKIKKVAVCGGGGSFLIKKAIQEGADIFITGEIKYHQFFEAEQRIVLADIGHFESEQFTKDIFYELLIKKFPKFAVHFSETNTNPINYL